MASDLYISRNEAAKLSGASATVINKAIEQRAVRTKRSRTGSLIDARDTGALQIFGALTFGLPVTMKRRLTAWLRNAEAGAELPLTDALLVRKSEASDEATARALRYVELRERFLEVNPDVQGGEPVIRGTRIPIRGLAKQIEAGEATEVLRREYDYIDPDAFEFAVLWAGANPRRGRPSRTEAAFSALPPAARAELLAKRRPNE
ncbi:MAG: DUF433 domain-containing protein [Patulibacter sp.]|nr:DUF433 domain-containing protein [Patulibacter sp.]